MAARCSPLTARLLTLLPFALACACAAALSSPPAFAGAAALGGGNFGTNGATDAGVRAQLAALSAGGAGGGCRTFAPSCGSTLVLGTAATAAAAAAVTATAARRLGHLRQGRDGRFCRGITGVVTKPLERGAKRLNEGRREAALIPVRIYVVDLEAVHLARAAQP